MNKKEHFEQRETLKSNMGEVREMWTVYGDLIHQALGWCVQRAETRKEEGNKSQNRVLSDLENGFYILDNYFIFQWSLRLTDAGNF